MVIDDTSAERHDGDIQAVREALGKRVRAIHHERFVFPNSGEVHPSSLELCFEDRAYLTLRILEDEETVGANNRRLPVPPCQDASDSCTYEWELRDLTAEIEDWQRLQGAVLVDAAAKIDVCEFLKGVETLNGWKLKFSTGDFVVFFSDDAIGRVLLNQDPAPGEGLYTCWEPLDRL